MNHKLVRFDWAMKNILRNKANFDILEGFLSELLKEQIKIDQLLESESNSQYADDKFNRVDLLAHTSNDEKIIIEVQTASEWDFYHRILFGISKVITEYIELGQPFSQVPKVISVSILHFNLGDGSDYMYRGITEFTGMHSQEVLELKKASVELYINEINKEYTSVSDIFPTYYLIQLPKFTGEVRDKFDQWVYFLKKEEVLDNFDAQGILSAKDKLDILKLSRDDMVAYDKYWQNVSVEASLAETHQVELNQAKREGEQIGKEIGEQIGEHKGKLAIAKKMLKSGLSVELAVEMTELSVSDVYKLKSEL